MIDQFIELLSITKTEIEARWPSARSPSTDLLSIKALSPIRDR